MQIAILLYYRFIITVLYISKNSLSMARLFKHTKTFSNISFLQLYNIWYFVWTWSLLISFVIIILIWSNFANNVRWLTMQTCLKSQQKEMWIQKNNLLNKWVSRHCAVSCFFPFPNLRYYRSPIIHTCLFTLYDTLIW